MNKKNHYINLFVLACMMVLAITSCQQELMPVQPEADSARTLTFTLNMPQGKPAFGEGESRAATTGTWAEGDELLMTITADEYMIQYLTLQHNASGTWDVLTGKSYTHFTQDNSYAPYSEMPMLTQTTDLSLSGGTWTVCADEAWPENLPMSVQLVYAPDMEFNAEGGLALKADATTSLPEYWEAASTEHTDGTLSLQWTQQTNARLRIYTGMAGDEVKLTSEAIRAKFARADHTYTATTQADGYACFYCTTTGTGALTSGFQVELTTVMGLDLDTPATLLQATSLVSVALTAGQSYKLDAQDKRQKVVDEFIVIDGDAPESDLEAMKAAILAGYNAGKRIIKVTGKTLTAPDGVPSAVVGKAILGLAGSIAEGSLSLLMPEVEVIPGVSFIGCYALKSVSAPAAITIMGAAFRECTFLQSVSLPVATSIGQHAFAECISLQRVSFPSATSIEADAFSDCSALASASFPSATLIWDNAFNGCKKLATLSFGSVIISVWQYAFRDVGSEAGGCDLHLAEGQRDIATDDDFMSGKWGYYNWKSITVGGMPMYSSELEY